VTTQDFVVYFAWDRADLDAAAQRVIDMAAAAARSSTQARINLVGHADLSGSPDYNLRLSLRRADAVRQALVARGITADRTNVTGVGDSEPAVPTARGVREPRNRFVSVTIR
jgi:OmpA-OmpF porin, OOP family